MRMFRLITTLVVIAMLSAGCGSGASGEPEAADGTAQPSDAATTADIRAVIDRYVKAVNDADQDALRELLAQPDSISFVNPMQRLTSWGQLQGFWQGFLKNNFTRRELKPSNVAIHTVGDAAWAVFDWEFSGMQTDGKPFQSRGWETHVYQRTDRGWRIRHVHYSGAAAPPPTGS
jgi:ketosteroid isomerase-like protein